MYIFRRYLSFLRIAITSIIIVLLFISLEFTKARARTIAHVYSSGALSTTCIPDLAASCFIPMYISSFLHLYTLRMILVRICQEFYRFFYLFSLSLSLSRPACELHLERKIHRSSSRSHFFSSIHDHSVLSHLHLLPDET